MNALFRSWRTTILGFGAAVVAAWPQISAWLDNDPTTVPDWSLALSLALAAVGLGVARDNKVSSEKAGAK